MSSVSCISFNATFSVFMTQTLVYNQILNVPQISVTCAALAEVPIRTVLQEKGRVPSAAARQNQ